MMVVSWEKKKEQPTAGLEPAITVSGGQHLNQLGHAGFVLQFRI